MGKDTPVGSEDSHPDVAIIGAGPAGLAAARELKIRGLTTRVVDKGRGPGGRLSTRRMGETRFDHGAHAFDFPLGKARNVLERWTAQGVVGPWHPIERGKTEPSSYWVGTPAMNAVLRTEADELQVAFGTRITELRRNGGRWSLIDQNDEITCQSPRVIVAIPAPQAKALLAPTGFRHLEALEGVEFDPVWAFMFEGPDRTELGFDALKHPSTIISHAEAQSSKPGRRLDRSWVAHATVEWSQAHLEDDARIVEQHLAEELSSILGSEITPPWSAHRWRYALVRTPVGMESLIDETRGLTACGDWCLGSTVEHALLSGRAAGRG